MVCHKKNIQGQGHGGPKVVKMVDLTFLG